MVKNPDQDKYVLSSSKKFSCPWFEVYKEKIRFPNGHIDDYFVFKRQSPFVAVVAVQKDEIFIIKQWRPTLKRWIYELPMGGINGKETPQKAAQREFLEETGYKAKTWKLLGEFWVAPGYSSEKGYVFLATGIIKITGRAEDNPKEMIEVLRVSVRQLKEMIRKRELRDGPSLASLMLYLNTKNSKL
ncbi:MAG: NUDIX hydrolase [Patescibacteria group bacterium]|jgi:ADP-ribose pyrophosphatase